MTTASNALLLLVGVPENYRLGGPAFQRLHQAHPRVQVRIVHDQAEFARQVTQADAVIGSRPYLKLSAEVAKPGARLRWVQTTTAGVDQAVPPDLLAAEHVTVTCIKGPPGPLMAEHAVLLMLALSRNLPVYLKNQQLHIWRREGQDWLPLHGQTIAILGVGSGGGNLARVCKTGFGMTVLGMTRTPREIPHVDRAFGKSGLLSVLPEADFVVLCLPHTPETRHIINAAAFDAMKPTACLINVSRGALIDEDALIAAMRAGRIAGAGLDVTTVDPIPRESPLWDLPNTIITPHIATESVKMSDVRSGFLVRKPASICGKPAATGSGGPAGWLLRPQGRTPFTDIREIVCVPFSSQVSHCCRQGGVDLRSARNICTPDGERTGWFQRFSRRESLPCSSAS